jgi:8-oxo-dGTP pyrophosphatase MutT (NUDIX family)
MSFLDHIRACNSGGVAGYCEFRVAGDRVGWLRPALLERLAVHRDVLTVVGDTVDFAPGVDDFAARTAAVDRVLDVLVADGVVSRKRGEHYPVLPAWGQPPLFSIDRAAVSHFGVAAYGVHVNGMVRRPDGGLDLWIARRSRDRSVAAGKLDNLIAGGQPIGLTLAENLVKEAYEEAAIGPEQVARAVPAGVVTYIMEAPGGLKVDCLFVYDLELEPDFVPRNTDGEVESFERMPWQRVAGIVQDTDDFKFNCNLVVIDFLIRHGLIPPEHPHYLALVAGLRRWG